MILQKKLWSSDLCTEVGIRTSDYFLSFVTDLLYNTGASNLILLCNHVLICKRNVLSSEEFTPWTMFS